MARRIRRRAGVRRPLPVRGSLLLGAGLLRAGAARLGQTHRFGRGLAVADRHVAVERSGHVRVVGDDHHRHAELAPHGVEQREQPRGVLVIERTGRFVGEQHLRPVGQGDGDRHALLLAGRHRLRPVLHAVAQPDHAQQLLRPRPIETAGHHHRQLDVLDRGQIGDQVARGVLPDEADVPAAVAEPLAVVERHQVDAGDPRPAGRWGVQAAQHAHQRRLAAAARADDPHQLAALHLQVEPLQGDYLDVLELVYLDQARATDRRAHGSSPSRTAPAT